MRTYMLVGALLLVVMLMCGHKTGCYMFLGIMAFSTTGSAWVTGNIVHLATACIGRLRGMLP